MDQDTSPDPWELRGPELLRSLLARAARGLEMDVAFVAEFDGGRLAFRALGGDAGSFGWEEGASIPLEGSYCRLVADGTLPGVVPLGKHEGGHRFADHLHEGGVAALVGA